MQTQGCSKVDCPFLITPPSLGSKMTVSSLSKSPLLPPLSSLHVSLKEQESSTRSERAGPHHCIYTPTCRAHLLSRPNCYVEPSSLLLAKANSHVYVLDFLRNLLLSTLLSIWHHYFLPFSWLRVIGIKDARVSLILKQMSQKPLLQLHVHRFFPIDSRTSLKLTSIFFFFFFGCLGLWSAWARNQIRAQAEAVSLTHS